MLGDSFNKFWKKRKMKATVCSSPSSPYWSGSKKGYNIKFKWIQWEWGGMKKSSSAKIGYHLKSSDVFAILLLIWFNKEHHFIKGIFCSRKRIIIPTNDWQNWIGYLTISHSLDSLLVQVTRLISCTPLQKNKDHWLLYIRRANFVSSTTLPARC